VFNHPWTIAQKMDKSEIYSNGLLTQGRLLGTIKEEFVSTYYGSIFI